MGRGNLLDGIFPLSISSIQRLISALFVVDFLKEWKEDGLEEKSFVKVQDRGQKFMFEFPRACALELFLEPDFRQMFQVAYSWFHLFSFSAFG